MRYCTKCGHPNDDSNSFCINCGNKLVANRNIKKNNKKLNKKLVWILISSISVLLAIIIGISIYAANTISDKNKEIEMVREFLMKDWSEEVKRGYNFHTFDFGYSTVKISNNHCFGADGSISNWTGTTYNYRIISSTLLELEKDGKTHQVQIKIDRYNNILYYNEVDNTGIGTPAKYVLYPQK